MMVWRPRRDLNPCYRRERPVSWAELDDGDVMVSRAGFEPATLCLKVSSSREIKTDTLLDYVGFSTLRSAKNNPQRNPFGDSSRTKDGQRYNGGSAIHKVFIAEQHLYRSAIRQRHFSYQKTTVPGIHLRRYKPRTIKFRKRETALCVALSAPEHALQTWVRCLWGIRFRSGDEVVDHFSKVRSRWQQQNPAACTRDSTDAWLPEKSLSCHAIFARFRIGFVFRVIELRLHLYKQRRKVQAEHPAYTNGKPSTTATTITVAPGGCHLVPIAIAHPASWMQAHKAANLPNLPLTAKRMFRSKSFQRKGFFLYVRKLSVSARYA